MTSREKFEAWMTAEQWFHGSDFEWDECRNCYAQFGIHLAYKAFMAAEGAAEQNLTDMAVQLANAESKCRELAVENVTLNDKMNRLATWPGIEFYSSAWEFCNLDGNDALEFMCDVKTPATDAHLAEVRAQARTDFIGRIEWIIRNECNQDKTEAIISELQKFSDELKLEAAQ